MSKYKLINLKTKEEHLCDKVTIDGFDYYVSDKETKWAIDETGKLVNLWFYTKKLKGFVLATTNPNIDIPKVINEVDYSKLSEARQMWQKGYNKSQETHPFSEEDMIEFSEWYFKETFNTELEYTFKSTKKLLQLWKEQKSKIVYYGND